MLKFDRETLASALAAVLTACSPLALAQGLAETDPYFPKENLRHKQVIDVSGNLDPELALTIRARYRASSADCRRVEHFASGQRISFLVEIDVPFSASAGSYKGQFARDRYDPGACGWYFDSLIYQLQPREGAPANSRWGAVVQNEYGYVFTARGTQEFGRFPTARSEVRKEVSRTLTCSGVPRANSGKACTGDFRAPLQLIGDQTTSVVVNFIRTADESGDWK